MSRPRTLSVVVPAHNEAGRIETTLHAIAQASTAWDLEIVVVDDGSDDDTAALAEAFFATTRHGQVVRLERNQGKGAAVRAGVLRANGHAIVFMDADLATDLAALGPAVDALDEADVVIGTRVGTGASVRNGTWMRSLMARVLRGLVRAFTALRLSDTQCGFKAFRGDVGRELFGLARCRGFAFDVEILVLAQRLAFTTVEIPVQWTAVSGSSVRPVRDSLRVMFDLALIAARWTPRRTRRAAARASSEPRTLPAPVRSKS